MRNLILAGLVVGYTLFCCYAIGCTKNTRAKSYGGTMTVNLPECQKLVIATWKDEDLWYLTRPWRPTDVRETSTFQEDSVWGLANGTVKFVEHCSR